MPDMSETPTQTTTEDRRQTLRNIEQRRAELVRQLQEISAELAHMEQVEKEHRQALSE